MNNTNKDFKKKLLETFYEFDRLCKNNNIRYFASGGTLIGAIRHHGLIPWDDDVDVCMLRGDYEKLLSLRGKVDGHYDIMDDRDEGYWLLSLAKFIDTDTTLWEMEEFPCVTGVYIDIFPIDECNDDIALSLKNEYDKISGLLTRAMKKYTWRQFYDLFVQGHMLTLAKYLKDTIYYRPQYNHFRKKYDAFVNNARNLKGNRYISYDGMYKEREIFDKRWFSNVQRVPFETFEIDIPVGYHEFLTQEYGDYMQLPPEEKRVSHHCHYFLDLDRRWTIEEIKEYKKHH